MGRINFKVFKEFARSEATGGIILFICVAVSLVIANSSLAPGFQQFLDREIGSGSIHVRYSIVEWVNDGLMAIFFLLVGLEIKRALIEGELSSVKRASLPVFAAIGGAIIPALIYWLFNQRTSTANGWGIPMATDIAFALAVISLLGDKVPASLKIFLAALAIVDDLIAILIIAIFYSDGLHWNNLFIAMGVFAIMIVFNRLNINKLIFYIIPGIFLWYFVHLSGVHSTIAGVLMALTIPTTTDATVSPLEKMEHFLTRPVNFLIMPIFALVNTNITFTSEMLAGLSGTMGAGIAIGLLLGKPIGITLISWIVVKSGLGKLPRKTTWRHIVGVGILGGIGFTMSIFITLLSFRDTTLHGDAKFAIVLTSVIAGVAGFLFLKYFAGAKKTVDSNIENQPLHYQVKELNEEEEY